MFQQNILWPRGTGEVGWFRTHLLVTANIHVDRALIVARIELDWGACVVSDPDSD